MELEFQTITREIAPKEKGYLVVRRCDPAELDDLVRREADGLFAAGAKHVFVTSKDPDAQLAEGAEFRHVYDMLGLYRDLDDARPRPQGRLTLEPLTAETGAAWAELLNRSFHFVPSSATYLPEEVGEFLTDQYRCGFALLDGARVGVYECRFKKAQPEIGSVGLDEGFRGQGLGRELLLTVMDYLAQLGHRRCWLQVATTNTPAHALYRSVGFGEDELLCRWFEVSRHG